MDRGTYTATSAGYASLIKLEIVANNLANVNTAGFKRQTLIGQEQTFEETLAGIYSKDDPYARGDHERTPGVVTLESGTDFSAGPIQFTGNSLDLALRDPMDFFMVQTPRGIQYTRAGNFTLNSAGQIVTADGLPVVGDGGPLTVGPGKLAVEEDGSVVVNGVTAGRFGVVHFDSTVGLKREAGARFTLRPAAPAPRAVEAQVIPRSLEASNVSTIHGMLDLMTTQRGFDAYTRASNSLDNLNRIAITEVGRK